MDTTDGSNFLTYLRGWETMHTRNPDAQSRKSGVDTSTLATGVMANNWPTVRLRAFPWTRRNKRLGLLFCNPRVLPSLNPQEAVWNLKLCVKLLSSRTHISLSLSIYGRSVVSSRNHVMWCIYWLLRIVSLPERLVVGLASLCHMSIFLLSHPILIIYLLLIIIMTEDMGICYYLSLFLIRNI